MRKFLLLLLFPAAVLLTSCAAMGNQMTAARNMTRIELGMTKRDVVKIMGDTYQVIGSRATREGTEESIGYLDNHNDIYILTFLNGKLVEYHKEWLNRHDHDHGQGQGQIK
jgi:hypothetical protein